MRFQQVPNLFAGLLYESTRKPTLKKLRRIWKKILEIEKLAQADPAWENEFNLLVWPYHSWCLEILIGLAEAGFITVDEDTLKELREWAPIR